MPTETITVPELGCEGCENIVEGAVGDVDGVDTVAADQAEGTVTVEGDGFDVTEVANTIELAGYDVADAATTEE